MAALSVFVFQCADTDLYALTQTLPIDFDAAMATLMKDGWFLFSSGIISFSE